jgi:hypothetical protein
MSAFNMAMSDLFVAPPIGRDAPYRANAPGRNAPYAASIGDGGRTYTDSEVAVVQTYIPELFDDGCEQKVVPGDPLFICRVNGSENTGRSTIVNLSKFNQILRQGWIMYSNSFPTTRDTTHNGPDSAFFGQDPTTTRESSLTSASQIREKLQPFLPSQKDALDDLPHIRPGGEEIYLSMNTEFAHLCKAVQEQRREDEKREAEAAARLNKPSSDSAASSVNGGSTGANKDVAKMYRGQLELLSQYRDTYARYATLEGILKHWNFLGVLNNTSGGKSAQQSVSQAILSGLSGAPVYNVVLQRRCRVANYWGSVNDQTDLFFVFQRRKTPEGHYAEWQLVPYKNDTHEGVDPRQLLFPDLNGIQRLTHYWYVGKVRYTPSSNHVTNAHRLSAAGLPVNGASDSSSTLQSSFESSARLNMLDITLRVR